MRLGIGARVGAMFTVVLAGTVAVGLVAHARIDGLVRASRWVTHTQEVLTAIDGVAVTAAHIEAHARSFALRGEPSILVGYRQSIDTLDNKDSILRRLVADNELQQRRCDRLDRALHEHSTYFDELVSARDSSGLQAAAELAKSGRGSAAAAHVVGVLGEMGNHERELLTTRSAASDTEVAHSEAWILAIVLLTLGLGASCGFLTVRRITRALRRLLDGAAEIGAGKLDHRVELSSRDELGALGGGFNRMAEQLSAAHSEVNSQVWIKSNLATLSGRLQGQRDLQAVCRLTLSELAPLVGAQHGVVFTSEHDASGEAILKLQASYAYSDRKHLAATFRLGEGLVGQCALERQRITITEAAGDYVRVVSGLGQGAPMALTVVPLIFENNVQAVLELASLRPFTPAASALIDQVAAFLGTFVTTVKSARHTEALLKQSRDMADELQAQQEELKQSNQQLEDQARSLLASEEAMRQQREELQKTNQELEQKSALLLEQKTAEERRNVEIEQARLALHDKAEQLAVTSRYKSEFLANMSHELRTPLNSLLLLAETLTRNAHGHLSDEEVKYASTIHASGNDLLALINDILDLARIEAGAVRLDLRDVRLQDQVAAVDRTFRHVAQSKGVTLETLVAPDAPSILHTDDRRLLQVLKNLVGNALKFTERGSVVLEACSATSGWNPGHPTLNAARGVVGFKVRDTGIGIAAEHQRIIFEAFQQADASTSRKYGGTGLGLAISRELTALLGGELRLEESRPGAGSCFTLYVPVRSSPTAAADSSPRVPPEAEAQPLRASEPFLPATSPAHGTASATSEAGEALMPTPRGPAQPRPVGEQLLLIVEDDTAFAEMIAMTAHKHGFATLVAPSAAEAIEEVRKRPPVAITLDIGLPDASGWAVLDHLKRDQATRHIPVHIISADDDEHRGFAGGALGFLRKPVSWQTLEAALSGLGEFVAQPVRRVLVVAKDATVRQTILSLASGSDVAATPVESLDAATNALAQRSFDCIVMDWPDDGSLGTSPLACPIRDPGGRTVPCLLYVDRELSLAEEAALDILRRNPAMHPVRSRDHLLDDTTLFLHRVLAELPESERKVIHDLHANDPILAGKRILVVDDDVRNLFAMSAALAECKVELLTAETGQAALEAIGSASHVDLILMDVMMPLMDGYEATRRIRKTAGYKETPIIAITAKAMKEDRDRCLAAGYSDYITKPVDMRQLQSLMRVWLYR